MRNFDELSEQEILALAISSEEEDRHIYLDVAEGLRADYAATAQMFLDMAAEEDQHRRWLIDLYQQKFGEHIPLVKREHVRGFVQRKPVWQLQPLNLGAVRRRAEEMEFDAAQFYRRAAARSTDASIRKLLGDLALVEAKHERAAERIMQENLTEEALADETETARKMLVLRFIQPGLAGLMDGSVSTLAPVFAAAFASGSSWEAFLVGLAASIGAGISMGFAEALSDNGSLTGRGAPLLRGVVCGVMTPLGGIGHTLPFLIGDFHVAMIFAIAVVVVELAVISWVRWKYMDTPPVSAAMQVGFGGALVFAAGVLIGGG